jgi:hypothetical protein
MDDDSEGCLIWGITDIVLLGVGFLLVHFDVLPVLGWVLIVLGVGLLLLVAWLQLMDMIY